MAAKSILVEVISNVMMVTLQVLGIENIQCISAIRKKQQQLLTFPLIAFCNVLYQ